MNAAQNPAQAFPGEAIDRLSSSILKTMLYYDLFNYPLTVAEIKTHCAQPGVTEEMIRESLDGLCDDSFVFRYDQYYSVQNDGGLFLRRIKGNMAAEGAMKKVLRRSRLIASFPYVRCVCVSGSLSKNYFDETTDADFFIITEPNRLWICRTFLIFFKKIFLRNSKKYFCVNYFIDAENLVIPDKNIFTATELTTLLPLYNYALYQDLFNANPWVRSFFPNSQHRPNGTARLSKPVLKHILEKSLKGKAGEWLDTFFMKMTLRRWKKEFGWQPQPEFEVNMRTRRNVSKHHPQGFQFRILNSYQERIQSFERQHQLILS